MNRSNRKILIAYFSRKGNNYTKNGIADLKIGNTEKTAEIIHDYIGGDIFEIRTENTYSSDYNKCVEEAKNEKNSNFRPKLIGKIENVKDYECVFLGYPNWWGTMPMAVFSFLEHYDLNGKIIVPFCTHEGSGMGVSENDLKNVCPKSKILKGLAVKGSEISDSHKKIEDWINSLNL